MANLLVYTVYIISGLKNQNYSNPITCSNFVLKLNTNLLESEHFATIETIKGDH